MLAALSSLACTEPSYQLLLVYPDQDALDRARFVDLFVGEGIGCDVLPGLASEPRLTFDAQGDLPELGTVSYGLASFYAEVRDEGCRVFVDGCVQHQLEAGQDVTVRIALLPAEGPICGPGQSCQGGRCVSADGGVVDAGVIDAAATDVTALDTSAADGSPVDASPLDASGIDASGIDASGIDASGIDAYEPDAAPLDAAQPDTLLPDAAVCAPSGTTCVAGELVTCDEDGQPQTTTPCVLGCNSGAAPQRCNRADPSNLDPDILEGWTQDLSFDSSAVLDTGSLQLDGVDLDPSDYQIVTQGAGAPQLLVLGGLNLTVAAGVELRVVGTRALALVATETVSIAGVVDASATGTAVHWDDPAWPWFYSELGGPGGYGGGAEGMAGDGDCPGIPGEGLDVAMIWAKGSGGGGHGGPGGEGGDSLDDDPNDPQPLGGGEGGDACGVAELTPLVGGSGGAGAANIVGEGPAGDWAGPGGGGGGAIQISAGESVTIASGAGIDVGGGGGGQSGNSGGPGGGAGGAILIEAPHVFIEQDAFLTANGGGGASGDCT